MGGGDWAGGDRGGTEKRLLKRVGEAGRRGVCWSCFNLIFIKTLSCANRARVKAPEEADTCQPYHSFPPSRTTQPPSAADKTCAWGILPLLPCDTAPFFFLWLLLMALLNPPLPYPTDIVVFCLTGHFECRRLSSGLRT